jgi:mannitol/fructose-specific phosphotransferase system IIA component (Ntr-type)
MRESRIINYRPTFKSPLYPWVQIFAIVAYLFLIFEMGTIPLVLTFSFVVVSFLWFFVSARTLKRESALMHLVERVTAKELVETSLEDELKEILHKRDNVIKDRFDHLIEDCPVLDLDSRMDRDTFFSLIAEELSSRLGVKARIIKDLLIKRELQSTTVIEKELALPHIVVEGSQKFEVIVVRAKDSIDFSPHGLVKVAFVLAGSKDERNFHLCALMAIANIVREQQFLSHFMKAKTPEQLKMVILSSTRKRQV